MNIADYLYRSAAERPLDAAVERAGVTVTFGELERRAGELRDALVSSGARPGDRVAVVAKNCLEYVYLYFAAASSGAVLVPINWRLRPKEVHYQLEHSHAAYCFCGEEFRAGLLEAREQLHSVREWVLLQGDAAGWRRYCEYIERGAGADRNSYAPAGADPAVQMYTSGTTGAPRGAMLTHQNILTTVPAWLHEIALRGGESRFLQVTPLFHVGGMLMLMSCVAAGATLVLHRDFDPANASSALACENITHALFVPAMIQWLLRARGIDNLTFPKLELIIYGAAPMPAETLKRAMSTFKCNFLQGYGLTETCGLLTILRPDAHEFSAGAEPPRRLASAGRPMICCEVRIVTPRGDEAAPGEVGEVVARGLNITPGYYAMPDATAAAFEGGWFHTGDLAFADEDRYIYIVDRSKDMIIVGGENVYPREIEDMILTIDGVRDAAVIGVPHDVWGEEVLALVVADPRKALAELDIIRHCRASLARFKCPTKVEFRPEIPRNAAGKIIKRDLREPYWSGRPRRI